MAYVRGLRFSRRHHPVHWPLPGLDDLAGRHGYCYCASSGRVVVPFFGRVLLAVMAILSARPLGVWLFPSSGGLLLAVMAVDTARPQGV